MLKQIHIREDLLAGFVVDGIHWLLVMKVTFGEIKSEEEGEERKELSLVGSWEIKHSSFPDKNPLKYYWFPSSAFPMLTILFL